MTYSITRRQLISYGIAASFTPSLAIAGSQIRRQSTLNLPPKARISEVTDQYWGVSVTDPYRWMEAQPKTAEWENWLKAQDVYAREILAAMPEQKSMLKRLEYYSSDVDQLRYVMPAGGKLFIYKSLKGEQTYKVFMRDSATSSDQLLIDPSGGRSPSEAPASLDFFSPAPNGKYIAYGISIGGSEKSTVFIKDIASGSSVEITSLFSRGTGWSADGKYFFYFRVREDAVATNADFTLHSSCWMHELGTNPKNDLEVLRAGQTPDGASMPDDLPMVTGAVGSEWVLGLCVLNEFDINLVYVAKAVDLYAGKPQWRQIARKEDGIKDVEIHGDHVYVLAKGKQSNGEIIKIKAANENINTGKVVLAASDRVLNSMSCARDGIYVIDLHHGKAGLHRIASNDQVQAVKLPQTGSVWGLYTAADEAGAWYNMDELSSPGITYKVDARDLSSRRYDFVRPSARDFSAYTTTRIQAPSRDGVKVPLDILHHRSIKLNRRNPVLMIAYGAYGDMLDPGFNPKNMAFLDAGGVIVYAHVRGGGEQGQSWHEAGKKASKHNTWRDAIDSAEHLIKLGWTNKKHLALWGTSAGGIMVGRAITERPDLFAAAIGEVGIFNALRFELTPNGAGNDAEFGTIKKEDEFHALLNMDAYHALKDGVRYPACMLLTGANDMRVEPWQVGKFAARLQATSTLAPGAVLRVDYESGHFAASRKKGLEKTADIFSFVLHSTK